MIAHEANSTPKLTLWTCILQISKLKPCLPSSQTLLNPLNKISERNSIFSPHRVLKNSACGPETAWQNIMARYILRLIMSVSERGTQNILSFCIFRLLTESTRQTHTHKHLHTHIYICRGRLSNYTVCDLPSASSRERGSSFTPPRDRESERETARLLFTDEEQ